MRKLSTSVPIEIEHKPIAYLDKENNFLGKKNSSAWYLFLHVLPFIFLEFQFTLILK
jgi:hypothetical protein